MIDQLPEDVQQRMMEKLLGKVNAERIKTATRGFRPVPVVVTFEFYEFSTVFSYQWRIDRIENGRKEPHLGSLDRETCMAEVAALKRRGFTVRQVTIGLEPTKSQRERAREAGQKRRSSIMAQLKDIKI
ncbi:hypothetical protein [Rhizobium sp. BK661]|uniref:hypothetical protein n=1 Tax=Rhizobium sp. BK661 TaxID=2586991 RepID=UPI002167A357|nr:hypothetical protein [Rhizobium sp. BK661]MCS3741972.1 hypothetical protein [Rhizobium sp. BK661]